LGVLLLGALAGGLIIHLYHAERLEQLYWDKEKLKVELFETTQKLARLEALWADQQEGEIRSIDLTITGELDHFVQLELQRLISEITSGLIGATTRDLEPDLVVALLHRRQFTVEEKDYLVTVNWVVIAPETLFNLSVSPAPGGE